MTFFGIFISVVVVEGVVEGVVEVVALGSMREVGVVLRIAKEIMPATINIARRIIMALKVC